MRSKRQSGDWRSQKRRGRPGLDPFSLLDYSSKPDYPGPFRGPCGLRKTGDDHTRVGHYGTDSKVSRRGHLLVTCARLYGRREFDTNRMQRMLASMRVAAGLARGCFPIRR
jgi:hypothetical protein